MMYAMHRLTAMVFLLFLLLAAEAQPAKSDPLKPYKLLTAGRQVTIKSTRDIKHVMLWTTNGYRVVEQKEINNPFYVLNIPVNQKAFFLMIGLSNGKIYTEKIGIQ